MKAFALLGEKLSHSLSVPIHEAFFHLTNQHASYCLYETPAQTLPAAARRIRRDYAGVNVTIPYKQAIISLLDGLAPQAQRVMAVNTVKNEGGRLMGYNTDVQGFMAMLRYHGFHVQNRPCAVLGTGGAARGAVEALTQMGAGKIAVFSRNPNPNTGTYPYEMLMAYRGGLIINCTPVGMYPNANAAPISKTVADCFDEACDMIYNPVNTQFSTFFTAKGKKTATGLYMLVAQAAYAQEIWFDTSITIDHITHVYHTMEKELSV